MNKPKYSIFFVAMMMIMLFFLDSFTKPVQATALGDDQATPIPTVTAVEFSDVTLGKTPSTEEQEEIKASVQSYIETRYRALSVSGSEDFKQNGFRNQISKTSEAEILLSEEMGKLAVEIKQAELNRLRYISYKVFLNFQSITIDPATQDVLVLVNEGSETIYEISTELDQEDPIVTKSGGLTHTIILHKEGNQWKIISDIYHDDLWRMLRNKGTSTKEILGSVDDMMHNLEISPRPSMLGNNSIKTQPSFDALTDSPSHPYDRDGAVNYAHKFWGTVSGEDDSAAYNPNYYVFTDDGGDCQNFVSQALYEGGNVTMYIPDPDELDIGTAGWYYLNIHQRGSAWSLVNSFYTMITDPDESQAYNQGPFGRDITLLNDNSQVPSGIALGDVIQYDWDQDGTWNHAAIVVHIEGGVPFVAAHSHNYDWAPYLLQTDPSTTNYRFIHIERSNGYPPVKTEVKSGVQDAGQNFGNCINSNTDGNIYLGKCTNGSDVTSGFQFQDVPIPSGATIKYAYLTFTVDGTYDTDENPGQKAPISLNIFGDPSGLDFSSTFPSARTNLTSPVPWDITGATNGPEYDYWSVRDKRTTPNLSNIVQSLVSASWNYGNDLTFIFKNNNDAGVMDGLKARRVIGFERASEWNGFWSARLVAAYTMSDENPATTPPRVYSVTRDPATPSPTNASTVNYIVTFTEPVTGVDESDFSITLVEGTISGYDDIINITPDTGSSDLFHWLLPSR